MVSDGSTDGTLDVLRDALSAPAAPHLLPQAVRIGADPRDLPQRDRSEARRRRQGERRQGRLPELRSQLCAISLRARHRRRHRSRVRRTDGGYAPHLARSGDGDRRHEHPLHRGAAGAPDPRAAWSAADRPATAARVPATRLHALVPRGPARLESVQLHALQRRRLQLWRRDVLEEVGGFATDFTCEDIELTFRVHEHFRRLGQAVRDRLARGDGRRRPRGRTACAS